MEEEELVDYELEEGGSQQTWSSPKDFIHSHFKINLEGHIPHFLGLPDL